MKIVLDLAGELEDALPGSVAEAYSIADGATLEELVAGLPFSDRVALTAVNGTLVPPLERRQRRLREGDEVTLLPPIKGG